MYEQFTEQFQASMKPVAALMEINIKTIEALAGQQTNYFTTALNDGLAYTKDISTQTDIAGFMKIQKEYSEEFQDKLMSATKDMYALMVDAQDQAGTIVKDIFIEAKELAAEMTIVPPLAKAKKPIKSAAK